MTDNKTISPAPAVSVVVPCYNEAEVVNELYNRVTPVCREVCGEDYEIVLVNDGSRDTTWNEIKAMAGRDGKVVGVNLSRNYGQQMATSAGLEVARGNRIFLVDCDLQDPPELLRDMMEVMDREKADVVYGQRLNRTGESGFKLFTSRLFYRVINYLSQVKIPNDTGDFRLMSRRIVNHFLAMPEHNRFLRGMISWIGYKQVAFPFDRAPRFSGKTTYSLKSMLALATDAITGYSIKPLRLTSVIGAVAIIIGLLTFLAGWFFKGFVIFLLGLQFICIGIIGEYLGRLYLQSRGRAPYLIESVINSQNPQER